MRTVNIGGLKARLSAYIQSVRDGEEVLVCDRNTPVARIIPCLSEESGKEQRLVARGVMAPPRKPRAESAEWPQPPGDISDDVMARIWRRERESR